MTIYGPAITVPGTTRPSGCIGWRGMGAIMRKELVLSCVSLHLFGTDFPSAYADADAISDYSTADHALGLGAGLGYNLTNVGAVPTAKYFTSGIGAYYDSPLTGDALTALGTAGQFSAFVVSKFTTANGFSVGTFNGSTLDGWGLGRLATSGGRYGFLARYAVPSDPADLSIIPTAGMGTDYDFLGVTACYDGSHQRANLYQQSPGGVMKLQNGGTPMVLPAVLGGLSNIRFGRSVSANYTAGQDLVFGALFNRELTAAEVQQLQIDVKGFLATSPHSITI